MSRGAVVVGVAMACDGGRCMRRLTVSTGRGDGEYRGIRAENGERSPQEAR
jgi:hypothetical protein